MFDPYGRLIPDYPYQQPRPQKHEIVRVNGRAGAETYQLVPNSEVLLLDTSAPIVWLKTADGAGYATCTPYSITPYQPAPEIDTSTLLARIERLEEMFDVKPDTAGSK